jgi:hypothetical protein
MWQLYKFCRAEKFDVVICNRFKPVNMMLTLNRWLKVPLCIGISHGFGEYDRFYRRRQTQRLIDRHWRFVGVSPAVKQYLLECDCGFTDQNTYAITNAIDIEQAEGLQHSREQARELLGIDSSVRLIGALGRLVPICCRRLPRSRTNTRTPNWRSSVRGVKNRAWPAKLNAWG